MCLSTFHLTQARKFFVSYYQIYNLLKMLSRKMRDTVHAYFSYMDRLHFLRPQFVPHRELKRDNEHIILTRMCSYNYRRPGKRDTYPSNTRSL
jgi:hypothetical protein